MFTDLKKTYLKPRPRDWHKGLSGHVLVIGGDLGYQGAPCMAGEAAFRVGAGLVSIATCPEHAGFLNAARPELMCHGIANPDQLFSLIKKVDVLVLGPGLGLSPWSNVIWQAAIQLDLPMVVDADALNILAQHPFKKPNWILTPHLGETSRLIKETINTISADRLRAARTLQAAYDGVAVLKGAGTIIAAGGQEPVVCDKGNPGMATAGMGDILSGVIGGLLAQQVPLREAAVLGVYLHAMAGDLAARDGQRGMIATDLLPYFRQLVNEH